MGGLQGEEVDVGPERERGLHVRNEHALVALDGETLHLEVAGVLVQAVPVRRVVRGPDGDAAEVEPAAVGRIEQRLHHGGADAFIEAAKRDPAELVEAAAEALPRLVALAREREGGVRRVGGLGVGLPLLPVRGLVRRYPALERPSGHGSPRASLDSCRQACSIAAGACWSKGRGGGERRAGQGSWSMTSMESARPRSREVPSPWWSMMSRSCVPM